MCKNIFLRCLYILFIINIYFCSIGRKKPLMIAIALQAITGFASAFVPWYELFLVLKFACAVTTGGTMLVSFVLRKSVLILHDTHLFTK